MSDTTYEPGIYQDIDGDVIKVTADGTQTVIAYGTPGWEFGNHIDMDYATKIADLIETAAVDPKPTVLEDGVYRDTEDGDAVLVEDGKVVEVLATSDGCDASVHLAFYTGYAGATQSLVRLVAPENNEGPLPTDGFYADNDGDLVQVKDGQVRYLTGRVRTDVWFDLSEEHDVYGPYTPLVEVASK